jgi:hypothetical protein
MLDRLARFLDVSTPVAAIALTLVVAQIATQIYALVDLARRNRVKGDKKWVWALLIALGSLPGAIAYLAAGRAPSAVDVGSAGSGASTPGVEAAHRALDVLYQPRDRR